MSEERVTKLDAETHGVLALEELCKLGLDSFGHFDSRWSNGNEVEGVETKLSATESRLQRP